MADDLNSVSSLKFFPFASFLSRLSLSCHFLFLLQFFSVIGSAGEKSVAHWKETRQMDASNTI